MVHLLGWPRRLEDGAKWSAFLFAAVVAAMGLPQLATAIGSQFGRLPSIDGGQLVTVLLVVGLGVLGYVAWRKGEEGAQVEPRLLPRRRALPPPPHNGGQDDEHFTVIDPTEDD